MALKENEKKSLLEFFWALIEVILSVGKSHVEKVGEKDKTVGY